MEEQKARKQRKKVLKKLKVQFSVIPWEYEEIRAIGKEIGFKRGWFAKELEIWLHGLLVIMRRAKEEKEKNDRLTEEELSKILFDAAKKAIDPEGKIKIRHE